jgi:hypothetical protein
LVDSLFYEALSVTRLCSIAYRVTSEWWWTAKDLVGISCSLILRHYPGICLEGLRKTTKNFDQDGWSPGPAIQIEIFRFHQSLQTKFDSLFLLTPQWVEYCSLTYDNKLNHWKIKFPWSLHLYDITSYTHAPNSKIILPWILVASISKQTVTAMVLSC